MKIVRVQYTTKPEYAATNQQNIRQIVNELKIINHQGIRYSAYVLPDGKSFMHLDHFENEEAHQLLQSLESFKKFSTQLWASEFEVEPTLDVLTLAATTEEVFI